MSDGIQDEALQSEWRHKLEANKLKVAAEILEEGKVNAALIRDLKLEPVYLPEEAVQKLETEFRQKVGLATRIHDQISDILGDPGYLSEEDLQKLKCQFVKFACAKCARSRPSSKLWKCNNDYKVCTTCYPSKPTCTFCSSHRTCKLYLSLPRQFI